MSNPTPPPEPAPAEVTFYRYWLQLWILLSLVVLIAGLVNALAGKWLLPG